MTKCTNLSPVGKSPVFLKVMTESSPDEPGGDVLLSSGIMGIVQPAVERLDRQVHAARVSQYTLNTHIQALAQCKLARISLKKYLMEKYLYCV